MGGILFLLCAGPLPGEDRRTVPVNVYVIVDGSENLRTPWAGALEWLCGSLVDGLLQRGDRLTIWTAGAAARMVYDETLGGEETMEAAKGIFRSISPRGDSADYAGALGQAAESARRARGMTYTLVVSGRGGGPSSGGNAALNLMHYSRVREFSGWRVYVVGLDIASQVEQAAAAFMRAR